MPEQNASLQANLSQALGQQPDPFSLARMQHQQMQAQDSAAMPAPFPDMQMGQLGMQQQQSQPSISQVQQPMKQLSFPDLAKQYGVDTAGLSPSKELGGLQLMKRMQGQFGPGFASHESFQPLMNAWQQHDAGQLSERDTMGMNSKAKRTLEAVLGGPS